jgi:hypothetical protein
MKSRRKAGIPCWGTTLDSVRKLTIHPTLTTTGRQSFALSLTAGIKRWPRTAPVGEGVPRRLGASPPPETSITNAVAKRLIY